MKDIFKGMGLLILYLLVIIFICRFVEDNKLLTEIIVGMIVVVVIITIISLLAFQIIGLFNKPKK
jgi:ABC-type multidrug transport system permease subunit